MAIDREALRGRIIRRSRRTLRRLRQLVRDQDYWNANVRKAHEAIIDVGKAEMVQYCEHLELVIEAAERGDERLPVYGGTLGRV